MSTSNVCQGLQSCLEPGLVEARVLRHKRGSHNKNSDALSFLQALAALPSQPEAADNKVYVHPMVKRSASALSAKSLDMCTESLGSETGSDDEISSLLSAAESENNLAPPRLARKRMSRRLASFPPPLTSMSSSGGLKVSSHREDGRLVLKATVVLPSSSYFHAERSEGRLRLRLVSFEPNRDDGGDDGGEEEIGYENCEEEEVETEDVDEKNGNSGVKMGKEKLEMFIGCKDDGCGPCGNNKRVLWDQPYLVAT